MIIMPEQANKKIKNSHGKIFSVIFRRKTDKIVNKDGQKVIVAKAGDLREMTCRTEVRSKLHTPNGEGKKYNFSEKHLVSVYDMQKKAYRSFSWENIIQLKIRGKEYIVLSSQTLQYCKENPNSNIAKKVEENHIEV
jgi:hypothetical protein